MYYFCCNIQISDDYNIDFLDYYNQCKTDENDQNYNHYYFKTKFS